MSTSKAELIRRYRAQANAHHAAAKAVLTKVTSEGRDDLTDAECRDFDRHVELRDLELSRIDSVRGTGLAGMKAELQEMAARVDRIGCRAAPGAGAKVRTLQRDLAEMTARVDDKPRNRARGSAFHEAGHAVAFLARGATVIEARLGSQAGQGQVLASPVDPVACMAGAAAARTAGYDSPPSDSDLALAERSIGHRSMRWARVEAACLVRSCWPAVEAVANALQARGTLNGDEVASIAGSAIQTAWQRSGRTYGYPEQLVNH